MHRNYQISNQDLLGRIPKIDEKMQLLTLGLLYSSLDVPKIVEYLLRVQSYSFFSRTAGARQFIVYLVCNESLVSSHHFAVHLA